MAETVNHWDLDGDDVHEAFHRVASSDPGAIGTGKYWLDTSSAPYVLKRRNGTNDGWVTIGGSGASAAADVTYDNSASGLVAADVQAALDEIYAAVVGGGLNQAQVLARTSLRG